MKENIKKLSLSLETVRHLQDSELVEVWGGDREPRDMVPVDKDTVNKCHLPIDQLVHDMFGAGGAVGGFPHVLA